MHLLVLIVFLICTQVQANTLASVDKTRISLGQNIRLKVSSDNSAGTSPNLSILKRSFKVIGHSKVSRPYIDNGVRKYKSLWFYILQPKISGDLQIPAISVNKQISKAIKIHVKRPVSARLVQKPVTKKKSSSHDIVVSATLNKTKLYPNEMLIYTLSINYPEKSVNDFKVKAPFVPGALIMPLAKASFKNVSQRSKKRTLRSQSFAIFAEQVAYYQVQPASVSFQSAQDNSPAEVVLKANKLHFEIQPKANQTSLGYWLPSQKINLEQRWSEFQSLSVGSSITRTLELKAYGLNADLLPLLSTLTHENIDIKLLDVEVENSLEEGQLLATRRERISMTFNTSGTISIQPIDIHWWNTQFNQARVSSLAPQSFKIDKAQNSVKPYLDAEDLPRVSPSIKTLPTKGDRPVENMPLKSTSLFSVTQLNWIIATLFILLVTTTAGWLVTFRKKV